MAFCIPKEIAEKLKEAARNGEITIENLSNLNSSQRRELFERYVDKEMAKEINKGFEKAIISTRKNALIDWVKATFEGAQATKVKKTIIDTLDDFEAKGILDDEKMLPLFEDLISEKLGVTVTADEVKRITELAENIKKYANDVDDWGIPGVDYWKATAAMRDYIDSIDKQSVTKILSSTVARGNMLFRTAASILNISANTVQGVFQAVLRRLKTPQITGYNKDLVVEYMKKTLKLWEVARVDITRSQDGFINNLIRGERIPKIIGDRKIDKVGKFYQDVVFEIMQGSTDIPFAAFARADSAMIHASYIARKVEKLKGEAAKRRTEELFKKSLGMTNDIDITTALIREKSIFDAQVATFTQDSIYADMSQGARALINAATGDIRLGDQIIPFVTATANVAGKSLDASGVTLPFRMVKGLIDIKNGKATKKVIREMWEASLEAGLGLTTAVALSHIIKPEDFIGPYPTNSYERELIRSGNATTNSMKIRGKWVSLDFLGPFASPLLAVLTARKYKSLTKTAIAAAYPLLNMPGIEQLGDVITKIQETLTIDKEIQPEEAKKEIYEKAMKFITSRALPAFVTDIAKGTDKYQREIDPDKPIQVLQEKLPILRKYLPIKETIFGEPLENESLSSYLLFGSRVKTATNDPAFLELERLNAVGYTVGISNVERSSGRVKIMKKGLSPEQYNAMIDEYRSKLHNEVLETINSNAYKRLSDEEKSNKLDAIERDVLDKILRKHGYKSIKKKVEGK